MKTRPPFTVVYEDDCLIVVDKAAGIPVLGERWEPGGERLDHLVAAAAGLERVYPAHRIDRDTSGLVALAKDFATFRALQTAFETRAVRKRYVAIVAGRPEWEQTICELPLTPDGNKRHLTIVDRGRGKRSVTRLRRLGSAGNYSVVEAAPETGRTHQIRVHLAALGHPVVCDPLYGPGAGRDAGRDPGVRLSAFKRNWRGDPFDERPLLARLGLHALELDLPGAAASPFRAPPARDMAALIRQMEKAAGAVFDGAWV